MTQCCSRTQSKLRYENKAFEIQSPGTRWLAPTALHEGTSMPVAGEDTLIYEWMNNELFFSDWRLWDAGETQRTAGVGCGFH